MQNAALEQAGREERIDMRSFERQGIEQAPTVHLGPAAFALEKKGIHTDRGDHNRAVAMINLLFRAVRQKISSLTGWLKELKETIAVHEKLERPEKFPLYGCPLFCVYEGDHTRQICSCAHIYACAKLPSGEEMLLAYFEFTKSSSGFRCFRADFLLYSNCVIVPSRRLKNSVFVPIYRLGA